MNKGVYYCTARSTTRPTWRPLFPNERCSHCGRLGCDAWLSRWDAGGVERHLCGQCHRQLQAREQREEARRGLPISTGERRRLALGLRLAEVS
jgi:hypothetical protein